MSDTTTGVLDLSPEGDGFLRNPAKSFQPSPDDVLVPRQAIRSSRSCTRHHHRPGQGRQAVAAARGPGRRLRPALRHLPQAHPVREAARSEPGPALPHR
ncbi:MAG: hypothetical protein IPH86_11270 [bacterium]|nr:hypothetical protein [bacterium]